MSDQEFYDIATKRIDKRNRRWRLWALDLVGLIFSVGAVILLNSTRFLMLSVAVMVVWMGVFTLHTILASMAQSREGDIEKEVAKLREAAERDYEKPKRLSLTEDGEIAEVIDWQDDETEQLHTASR